MSKAPDIPAAIRILDDTHAFCVVMRRLLINMGEGKETLGGDALKGLAEALGNIMYGLECATADLDQA